MRRKARTIDEYLAQVQGEQRAALDRLRETIRSIVPEAEECVSYGLPAFRQAGVVIAGFAATAKGCAYYPFSGSTLTTLAAEVEDFEQTKGSLHFDARKGLPARLVRKLLQARLAEARG